MTMFLTHGNETWRDEIAMRFSYRKTLLCHKLIGHWWTRWESDPWLGGVRRECRVCRCGEYHPAPAQTSGTSASNITIRRVA